MERVIIIIITDSHVVPALIRRFYEAKKNNVKIVECWGSGSQEENL